MTIKCDKCGSSNVRRRYQARTVRRGTYTMTEFVVADSLVTHVLFCVKCGHTVYYVRAIT